MDIPILRPEHHWSCPNCTETSVTHEAQPHSRMHACRGLRGLTAPMVPAGADVDVRAVEREDYVNGATATYDGEGRAVMGVQTMRADGSNDVAAFADCATSGAEN